MQLTKQQKEGFVQEGFVVVRGLLLPDIVTETREALLTAIQGEEKPEVTLYQKRFTALTIPCWTSEVKAVGEELVGPHIRRETNYSPFLEARGEDPYLGGYVPVLKYPEPGPKVFVPPTGGWHVDGYKGVSLYPELLYLVVFAYLSDVKDYGGATVVRPGSHRQIFESWHETGAVSDNLLPDLNWRDPIAVTGKAGDVIFMHCLMAHTGSPNYDEQIRVGLNSAIEPNPERPYQPKLGSPTADWLPIDYTLRTDTL